MALATSETLEQQLHRRERELAAIRRITVALHARTKPDELVRQTLDVAVETVDAASGTIYIHEPSRNKLIFQYVIGAMGRELTGKDMDADKGIGGQLFA